jgi:outer membrane protein TolC
MKRLLILLVLFFPLFLNAQQQLTLRNAIDTTLKNSFDIQIAENNLLIAKNNNSFGVAGGLPVVSASANDNGSINNIYQKNSSGSITDLNNVNGNSLNTGITASMTLFNGFKITATKERLSLLQKQNEFILNQQIQTAIGSVMIKYYDIIRQQSYLKILQQLLDVSNKKLDIVSAKNDVGMANGAVILQAKMDVNTAQENLKVQQLVIDQAKADLLLYMSSKSYSSYAVADSITVDSTIVLDSVLNSLNRNPQYMSALQQEQISQQVVKEVSAQRYPSVKINTSYNFAQADNSAGVTLMNQLYGPSAGLSLQIPIYYGGAYKAQREAAILGVNNSKLQKESLLNTLKTTAFKTYQSYFTNLDQLNEQQKNYVMAKKLLDLVVQNFQLNQATILDVKAAQTSYETAGYLLTNLQYAAKVSEIQLLSLMYKLK